MIRVTIFIYLGPFCLKPFFDIFMYQYLLGQLGTLYGHYFKTPDLT